MSKHTPGKWSAECVGSGGDYDNPVDVYEVTNGYKRIAEYVSEGDARLIAAAPDLLAACKAFEHAFKGAKIECEGLANTMNLGYAIELCRAAIARATGSEG